MNNLKLENILLHTLFFISPFTYWFNSWGILYLIPVLLVAMFFLFLSKSLLLGRLRCRKKVVGIIFFAMIVILFTRQTGLSIMLISFIVQDSF